MRRALKRWLASRGRYSTAGGEWPQYAGDAGSAKYSPLDRIDNENVGRLELAWVWDAFDNSRYIKPDGKKTDRRMYPDGFKATPLMVGGKLFIRTNFSGVAAVDPATGETLWTYDPGTADWGRPGIFGFATRGTVLLVGRRRRAAARLHGGQLSCRPGPRQRQAHPGFRR